MWQLNSFGQDNFKRLRDAADELGHPSLQLAVLSSLAILSADRK
jgi:hypothetical protein